MQTLCSLVDAELIYEARRPTGACSGWLTPPLKPLDVVRHRKTRAMSRQKFSSSDSSEFRKREQELLAKSYRLAEKEDLRPGEYRNTMVTDRGDKVGAAVFILEWVEFDSGA